MPLGSRFRGNDNKPGSVLGGSAVKSSPELFCATTPSPATPTRRRPLPHAAEVYGRLELQQVVAELAVAVGAADQATLLQGGHQAVGDFGNGATGDVGQ